mgnify:CR=1 FL=1
MKKNISRLDKNLHLITPSQKSDVKWVSPLHPSIRVEGLPWFLKNNGLFNRFPRSVEKMLRPEVWALSECPAGGCITFRSNTTLLRIKIKNKDASHMPHMPLSGSNGVSLFVGENNDLRPWGTAIPDMESSEFEREFFTNIPPEERNYRLYLPLYHPLQSLYIGIAKNSIIKPPFSHAISKPAVFYGTSITQGGCASTPGSDFINTLGRILNIEMINLGFSGNGKGDIEVAKLMAEINAAIYVLDYLANVNNDLLQKTLFPFYSKLRHKHKNTPILLLSSPCFWQVDFNPALLKEQESKRDYLMSFYVEQRKNGDPNIHFADVFDMLAFATENAYVDGVHPTDHGFTIIATRLAPVLKRILFRNITK